VFQDFIEPSSASLDLDFGLAFGVPWSLQVHDVKLIAEGVIGRGGSVVCLSTAVSDTVGGQMLRMAVVDDPEIESVYRAYAGAFATLGHFGPLNLQGKKAASGGFVPYEINGRFTGSALGRTIQGYNQVVYALDHFLSGALPPPRHHAAGTPLTITLPVYLPVDPSAASTLEREGRWDSAEASAV
jgi:hypothetical protein